MLIIEVMYKANFANSGLREGIPFLAPGGKIRDRKFTSGADS